MCEVALKQKRYSWRHDSVLATLEPALQQHITTQNESKKKIGKKLITFVKPGERKSKKPSNSLSHLLSGANDWQCQVDYRDKSKIFPPAICPSPLRPDIVIWSTATHSVILIELTCPSEENISQAKARKKLRYVDLLKQIEHSGWIVNLFTIEAGVRGCLSHSFFSTLKKLGMSSKVTRSICSRVSQTVSQCSYAIFHAYKSSAWDNPPLITG